jgi:hypothetical protein
MITDLNRAVIYDIGPVCVIAWFVVCILTPLISLAVKGSIASDIMIYVSGAIPIFALIWFVVKQWEILA